MTFQFKLRFASSPGSKYKCNLNFARSVKITFQHYFSCKVIDVQQRFKILMYKGISSVQFLARAVFEAGNTGDRFRSGNGRFMLMGVVLTIGLYVLNVRTPTLLAFNLNPTSTACMLLRHMYLGILRWQCLFMF